MSVNSTDMPPNGGVTAENLTSQQRKMAERKDQLIRLRQSGLTQPEIAAELKISRGYVSRIASKLIAEGLIETIPCGQKRVPISPERLETIISMVKLRATPGDIGTALGVSREMARYIIQRIADEHGTKLLEEDEVLMTPTEAADELGVSRQVVLSVLKDSDSKVPFIRRGKREYVLNEESMEALRLHHRIGRLRTCAQCKKKFTLGDSSNTLTCSVKCANRRKRELQLKLNRREPSCDSLSGWYKQLFIRLQDHNTPKEKEWLTIGQAEDKIGLSASQLTRLRVLNVVTTRDHPTSMRQSKPILQYARSELEIAKSIYDEYLE